MQHNWKLAQNAASCNSDGLQDNLSSFKNVTRTALNQHIYLLNHFHLRINVRFFFFFWFFSPVALKPLSSSIFFFFFFGKVFVVTRKGGWGWWWGRGSGVHIPSGRVGMELGREWLMLVGIFWGLEGRQAAASCHPHFGFACSVLSRGSCDHFQCFLEGF